MNDRNCLIMRVECNTKVHFFTGNRLTNKLILLISIFFWILNSFRLGIKNHSNSIALYKAPSMIEGIACGIGIVPRIAIIWNGVSSMADVFSIEIEARTNSLGLNANSQVHPRVEFVDFDFYSFFLKCFFLSIQYWLYKYEIRTIIMLLFSCKFINDLDWSVFGLLWKMIG